MPKSKKLKFSGILSQKKDEERQEVAFTTRDQKPTMHHERLRIERAHGYVQQGRVNGTLAVSRSFGDFEYKIDNGDHDCQKVSVIPEGKWISIIFNIYLEKIRAR